MRIARRRRRRKASRHLSLGLFLVLLPAMVSAVPGVSVTSLRLQLANSFGEDAKRQIVEGSGEVAGGFSTLPLTDAAVEALGPAIAPEPTTTTVAPAEDDHAGARPVRVTAVAPQTTTTAPPPPPTLLRVSSRGDRSGGAELRDGSHLIAGESRVFVEDDGSVRRVVYLLDGEQYRTERWTPFDFGGASRGWAKPIQLSVGWHTISAEVTTDSGVVSYSASVQVVQPPSSVPTTAPPPPPPPPPQNTTTTAPPAPPGPGPSWFPNASTTGVPAGVALTPSAGFTVTTPGTVIDGLDITGCLQVLADNVTVRNTRVRGVCPGGTVRIGQGYSGLLIEDVEIDGMGQGPGSAWLLGLSNYTCRRCNIHHGGNGIRMGANVTVEDSYIHHIVDLGQVHFTAVGCNGGHNIVLRHNTIDNPSGGSAALAFYGDFAPVRDVLVQDNFINGGDGYAAYGGAIPGKRYPETSNVRFIGNRWGRSYWPLGGQWGPITGFDPSDPGNVWSDNAFTDGQPINP